MKACFVSLVALVLAQNTNAQTVKECSPDAQLAISASVNTDQPKDKEDKYHARFVLTVKNRGSSVCNLTQPLSKLWKIEVYRQDPAESKLHALDTSQDEWTWTPSAQGQQDPSLGPGAERSAITEWKTVATKETNTYVVAATFAPTREVTAARFVLPPREMKIKLLVTGRLMGYYRVPDRQSSGTQNCEYSPREAKDPTKDPSPDASVFFSRFGRFNEFGQSPVNEIRLGMGDNFAPNYYSRSFDTSKESGHSDSAKYYYSWDTNQQRWRPINETPDNAEDIQNGHGTIRTDNVACFFLQAHYDAIVPAKHDIYYGPDRLRGLARLLASPPEMEFVGRGFVPRYDAVQMLATNMVIKTIWANGREPRPDSTKHQLQFVTEYPETASCPKCSFEVTSFSDRGFVFPWMQLVHVTAKGHSDQFDKKTAPHLFLCKAIGRDDSPGDPDKFMESSEGKFCNEAMPLDFVSDKFEMPAKDQGRGGSNKAVSAEPHELIYRMRAKSDLPQGKPSILARGHNYAICVDPSLDYTQDQPTEDSILAGRANQKKHQHADKPRPYCVRFSVYIPFFQYPDWPEERYDRGSVHYRNPSLYVLKNDREEDIKAGRTPVVIFGIVDPELLADVGADNSSWQTVKGDSTSGGWKKDNETQMAIVDPVETLNQLEDYFERVYEQTHKDSFQGLRVLMAEMSPGRAKQLAERLPKRLRFDVILSGADDPQATPNQEVRIQPAIYLPCAPILEPCGKNEAEAANGALATPTSFLVVPPGHDQADVRQVQARELTIKTDGASYWNYSLSGDPALVPVRGTSPLAEVKAEFWTAMCRSVPGGDNDSAGKDSKDKNKNQECNGASDWDESKKTTIIQRLALWSIRKKYGADIALLQKRDFYPHGVEDYLSEHCIPVEGAPLQCSSVLDTKKIDIQEILERVVWKGDVIKTRSVQGSVLKKVLEESDQFEEREKKAYLQVSDAGRPLVSLGIRKDPDDRENYLINSKPLDPKAIYTVATSDYIALGDTGYPELAKPPTGDLDRPALPVGGVYRIAGLACKEVQPVQNNCEERINAKDYFDRIANRQPDDPGPGNTNLHKFYAWTFLRPYLGQPVKKEADATLPLEKRVNWEWSFDQLSIGFSGLSHTETTEKLSQEFGGVLNSQVNANHSHSWDWDADSKLTFYHPKADWFVEETLQYSSSFIAQIDASRSETQSRNFLAFDGGTYLHLYPSRGKELPQFSLVLSGHFDTQVAGVLTNLAVNTVPVSASPATLTFNQGRTMFLAGRPGLRWQNRKSYIEAGLEGGSVLNTIKQFDITATPGGISLSCTLQDSVSLTNCINAFNQNNPNTPITASSSVRIERRPIDRYGSYWKIGMTVPINPIVSYSFRDRSEYYFLSSGDNLLNTRFLHELVNTVKFMVLPNLSFEPTYTIFLYENKLDYNFLLQQQYSVKINYSFSLSNLHESKRQFRYAKGSSE